MVSAAESPVHDNWKQAVIDATETDTVFLNSHTSPALRALRTETTNALEFDTETNAMGLMAGAMELYFGGDMNAAIARPGQVAGRIDEGIGRAWCRERVGPYVENWVVPDRVTNKKQQEKRKKRHQ